MKLTHYLVIPALALAFGLPASANVSLYSATLTGSAESPPNSSTGHGTASITIDDVLKTMRVQVSFADLVGMTTSAHIHCCTAAAGAGNAGVATMTPTFTGFPSGAMSGNYDHTFDMSLASSWNASFVTASGGTTAMAFTSLQTGINSGKAYFNLHSSQFPGGEIRGFLTPVPEPATTALMFAGLGLMFAVARYRKLA